MINIKGLLKRLDMLKSSEERQNFETLWQAGAEFCNPENSDIQTVSAKGQRRRITRITDVGIESRRGFETGMYAWAIGDGEFVRAEVDDEELMNRDVVKRWLNASNKTFISEIFKSNFDTEILQGFGELSYIGTAGTFSEWFEGGLNYKTQHISQMWFDVDARGRVNVVFVEIPLNARQIIDEFGADNVPERILKSEQNSENTSFNVVQCCMKNPHHDPESILQEHREYISTYMLREGEAHLRTDGYSTFPFSIARLYKAKNEMYGRSCYMESSQTISLHNDERYTLIRGAKNRADPPWIEAADSNTRHIRTNSISRVIYDPSAMGGPPQQMDIKSDVGITLEMLQMDRQFVERAFYIDVFNPILDQKNMTAYETRQRMIIGLARLTSALKKWQAEYAIPLFSRSWDLCAMKGKFPDMPEELEGKEIKFNFLSRASLALKEIEAMGILDVIEKSMAVAEVNPDILDNINFDEVIRILAEVNNVPNSVLRSKAEVEEMREARAQAQAKQQQIDNMPAIADGMYKASQMEGEAA
jgi:hypothetical protein